MAVCASESQNYPGPGPQFLEGRKIAWGLEEHLVPAADPTAPERQLNQKGFQRSLRQLKLRNIGVLYNTNQKGLYLNYRCYGVLKKMSQTPPGACRHCFHRRARLPSNGPCRPHPGRSRSRSPVRLSSSALLSRCLHDMFP